ncbi:hypothetical protein DENIS_0367 [Desulfonema ishimotonii]|uniref:ATPase AAA-type core domain-containing protein n=1 Tax=Desulfonema ishimotonii TaxID=45657 RepID=A0A401FR30_9BACT|nr:ATP-binding protein [Desulfonema ishimotonii]GBC59428.1 hypothetical protein DENIS_0367 [Desulfonema ishimotonii]
MIQHIALRHVGPSDSMSVRFSPRLNILTGDNGLGKTFVFDIIWWAMTRTWANNPAWPDRGKNIRPEIEFHIRSESGHLLKKNSVYDIQEQSWPLPDASPKDNAIVLYARSDGGISVSDPIKHDDMAVPKDLRRVPRTFHFSADEIRNGLTDKKGKTVCNGLIRDWTIWQFQKPEIFDVFVSVLEKLSPDSDEKLRPGKPIRVSVEDARDIPTLELPYGTIPITHISAGMQRIIGFAYLLVWAWSEHKAVASLMNLEPQQRITILFDEIESHLHPKWQRVILPAILDVANIAESDMKVQMIASTHAPLVLSSIETEFCENRDQVLTFDLADGNVSVREIPWSKQGDVTNWLVSDVFGLRQARSKAAEVAIEAANAFMRGEADELPEHLKTKAAIHEALSQALAGHDPFWPRWVVFTGGTA